MKHYLTNMETNRRALVEEAIRVSRRTDICIDDMPMPENDLYPGYNRRMCIGKYFSIYVDSYQDCSSFWREYERLENDPHWKVYISLIKDR